MNRFRALLLAGLMVCSAGAFASCEGKKPTDGTYNVTLGTRLSCSDADGYIKISSGGTKVMFSEVYLNRGLHSGDVSITDVEEYDSGVCYWKANYYLEEPIWCDGEVLDYLYYSGKAYANKKGKTLYVDSTAHAYAK